MGRNCQPLCQQVDSFLRRDVRRCMAVRLLLLLLLTTPSILFVKCGNSDNAPTQASQQAWTVSGKTYLVGSTDPLPGVVVKCAGLSSTSGSDGRYEIRAVPGGTQILTAEKAGCDNYSQSIEVNSDLTHFVYLGFQSTNLSGFVTNAVDGPIKGARVVLGGFADYTDISGRYEFHKAPRVTDTLIIIHPNYIAFKSAISLTTPDTTFDAILKRDSVLQGHVYAFYYVDQALPSAYLPLWPNNQILYLRANGYDSLGVYHDKVERNILLTFDFPQLLTDDRVSLLEGNLELCTDAPYPPFGIQTFAVESMWGGGVTYNTRPSLGPLLFSGSIGGASSAKYWTVLGTDGLTKLLTDYLASGSMYGVEIKGGTVYPIGIYSSNAAQNQPRIAFKVRF